MDFDKATLQKAADAGSAKVAEAFSKLAGSEAKVIASTVEMVSLEEALKSVNPDSQRSIVVYSQVISGGPAPGISLLTMARENALALVDVLNQQAVGTTGILKDIDRSALKETLNILSNSYMTALSESANIELGLGVPNMITSKRMEDIVKDMLQKGDTEGNVAITFETKFQIVESEAEASLFFIFNETLYQAIVASII